MNIHKQASSEEDINALIQKLKINSVLGLQTKLSSNQMKMLKDHKLTNKKYAENIKIMDVTNREEFDINFNRMARIALIAVNITQVLFQAINSIKPLNGR